MTSTIWMKSDGQNVHCRLNGGHELSDWRQLSSPTTVAGDVHPTLSDGRWRRCRCDCVEYSRDSLYGNYVINPIGAERNIYKMDAGAPAVIAASCAIINDGKKTRKRTSMVG